MGTIIDGLDSSKFPVVEIFKSIEGEGIRAGYPATFIRLAGCNLRCSYCDSMYAVENVKFVNMTFHEIYDKVQEHGLKRVTITGGEPLIHDRIDELIYGLVNKGYEVNIETNGACSISKYTNPLNLQNESIIVTMDYKCPSSGEESKMLGTNLAELRKQDVAKFVVGTIEDLHVTEEMSKLTSAQIFVSPVFGQLNPKNIVGYLLDHNMDDCRIQLQLHKFIWDPNERGV